MSTHVSSSSYDTQFRVTSIYLCSDMLSHKLTHMSLGPFLAQWIHERAYQNAVPSNQVGCFDKHPRCHEWAQRSPSECKVRPKLSPMDGNPVACLPLPS
jgi:hypothetical protein